MVSGCEVSSEVVDSTLVGVATDSVTTVEYDVTALVPLSMAVDTVRPAVLEAGNRFLGPGWRAGSTTTIPLN